LEVETEHESNARKLINDLSDKFKCDGITDKPIVFKT